MTDPLLRELERRAASEPAACVELSHALERIGRPAAALECLWRGCGDLDVRRATAAFACDRAVPQRVEVAWQAKLPGRDLLLGLRAWPLALVVEAVKRTLVLDPRTGEVRAELPGRLPVRSVLETLVKWEGGTLAAVDAWTGEPLWSTTLGGGKSIGWGEDLEVTAERGSVVAHRYEDPRRPPTERWRWPAKRGRLPSSHVEGGAVLVRFPDRSAVVLDARTGAERFRRAEVVPFVEHGVAVVRREGGDEVLDATDGRPLWSAPLPVHQITPTGVILREWRQDATTLFVHDHFTGVRTDTIELGFVPRWQVGDVYFTAVGAVVARTRDGELWSWKAKKPGAGYEVASLPGRVYVLTRRELFCLVDAA